MATGAEVLLDVLRTEGVTHLFGNPGTTELPLIDALAGVDDPRYVLALQEATAVGMADGYAQMSGRPTFLNLHTSAGLGNAIGNLTNAVANRTPIVVTAGQQDRRHIVSDPLLAGDLVGLARPVAKWAHEVRTGDELGTILRRAFRDAAAPPAGPVFVSLPMDLLDADGAAPAPPPSPVAGGSVAGGIEDVAAMLTATDPDKLAIIIGDEGASARHEVAELAAALGVRVFGSPLYGRQVFDQDDPHWAGPLAPAAAAIRTILEPFDRVLLVGGQAFLVYPYTPGPALPPSTELVHLSASAGDVGRTHPVRAALVGDPAATIRALLPLVRADVDVAAAAARTAALGERRAASAAGFDDGASAKYGDAPMAPAAAAHAIVRALRPNMIVVDEAITTGSYVRGFHNGPYLFCRGGGLGWGMPAALGASLAAGRDPVVCVVGDGSAMYSPQALWTAAAERLPVVFCVVNNRQYLILKNALRQRGGPTVTNDRYVGMDLADPPVDFVRLAESMGVDATMVEKAADVGDAVRAAIDSGEPHLLELPIAAPH
ncbi:MAG TPA: thiamine pyrophosphate-binding protein [Acidimicrobiales bacterium]|nr:thiamine pyrophosphate-binding protein [Acidimicrobiales bacterium]